MIENTHSLFSTQTTKELKMGKSFKPFNEISIDSDVMDSVEFNQLVNEAPYHFTDYSLSIYKHEKRIELESDCKIQYIPIHQFQQDITEKMRMILVDWLVEVHCHFCLMHETLFVAVKIMDRFIQKVQVKRGDLQLVGITALWIASKYFQVEVVQLNKFIAITAHAYNYQQFVKMEFEIMNTLNWKLKMATPLSFLRLFLKCCKCSNTEYYISYMVLDISLLDQRYINFQHSLLACAAVVLAKMLTKSNELWCERAKRISGYEISKLVPCIEFLLQTVWEQGRQMDNQKRRNKISTIPKKYNDTATKYIALSKKIKLQSIVV